MARPTAPPSKGYGGISWAETVMLVVILFQLPFVLGWSLLASPLISRCKHKRWRRILGDEAFRFLASSSNARQLQFCMGTTRKVFEAWAAKNGLPLVVEELGEDAQLFWIGPKRTNRVIIYFHGGGYVIPMQYFAASFWKYILSELKKQDIELGLAVLSYSLIPVAAFPTQLRQAISALEHIIASGVHPTRIQIVGDSAGGNLALQLLSHMLHPLDGIPRVALSSRLRGVYLMSPWVSLSGDTGSYFAHDNSDIVRAATFLYCGRKVLAGVPKSQHVYIEASGAPDAWFKGVDAIVDRLLITAGGAECLSDSIAKLAGQLCVHHNEVQFIMQEGGVHNDPYYDFLARESRLGKLTPLILKWLAEGFQQ